MEGTFGKIRNFFQDGIFGNIIRFLFDRFFGGIFTNNINFSNIINLKNCHFKDLTIDADKINKKAFKNGPFKLFSGKIGSISIKFPSLNALLTESLEVRLDRLDVLLVMNDVDFTKAEEEVKNLLAKLNSGELLQNIIEENPSGSNGPEDFDVYKKIINRILFNIKLKVENVCLRIVSEKPYKEVRLPIAPCFMLKIGKVEIKKNYDEPQNMMNSDSSNASPLNFAKHQDYSINIYGITMHMMANYELNPEEYISKTQDTTKAEFPFTYPNESHPSTFFVCACRKVNKKPGTSSIADDSSNDMEPISIRINFSNDKSKSVTIDMPNIEVMLDFLKIKYLSRYVDKFMEWKRYLDYKKALQEQYASPKKSPKASPQVVMHARKGSFGIDLLQEPISSNRPSRVSEDSKLATFGTMDNLMPNPQDHKNQKIRIAGLDIDVDYFQKNNGAENQGGLPENVSSELNEMEGINEIVSEPFEMTAENLLDTSNVHINLKLKSMYIYFLKNCTAFNDTEFKRWWLFGSEPQNDLQKSFNKKIPMSYFQLKLTNLNLSVFTKESQINIGFSSLKILDVARVDTPLRTKANPGSGLLNFSTINKSRVPWDKSDIFHSFRFDKSVMGMAGSALRIPDLKRNSSIDTNEQSMLFQSAMSDITKEFLQIREMRKQILDWDIDPKKEHFCVNVIFKFNKNIKYSGGRGGSDSYKTIKYLEDSVIHCPLNSEPLCEDLREDRTTPTVRLNTKGGKVTALIDFPSIYVNFYMGIVHDINFLLHNASDSYKMCENWYREQNHNLIVKWDQELRELSKDGPSKEELQ